jgi:hypothetical protein
VGRVDPEAAERTAPFAIQIVQSAGDLSNGRPQSFEKAPSGVGQGDAPGRAVQQAHTQPLFELPNGVAEGRGRDAEAHGGGSKAEILGDRHERDQVRKLASTHR